MIGGGLTAVSSLMIALFHAIYKGYQLQIVSCALLGAACAFLINPNVTRLATEVNAFCSQTTVVPSYGFLFSIFNVAFTLGDLTGPLLAAAVQVKFGMWVTAGVAAMLATAAVLVAYYGEMGLTSEFYQVDGDGEGGQSAEGGLSAGVAGPASRFRTSDDDPRVRRGGTEAVAV
jgi:MFS family permease